jgi:hypothetical protein
MSFFNPYSSACQPWGGRDAAWSPPGPHLIVDAADEMVASRLQNLYADHDIHICGFSDIKIVHLPAGMSGKFGATEYSMSVVIQRKLDPNEGAPS